MSKKLEVLAKESCLQNLQHSFHISEDTVCNEQTTIQTADTYSIRL
jgi:hypothetical protein